MWRCRGQMASIAAFALLNNSTIDALTVVGQISRGKQRTHSSQVPLLLSEAIGAVEKNGQPKGPPWFRSSRKARRHSARLRAGLRILTGRVTNRDPRADGASERAAAASHKAGRSAARPTTDQCQ